MAIKYVQIPNSVVRNEGKNITTNGFAVYAILKGLAFTERKQQLVISHHELKYRLGITDNRTIKEALLNLYDNGLIEERIEKLPIRSNVQTTIIEHTEPGFTQLPLGILSLLRSVGTIGFRLMFLYESFIKRKGSQFKQFAFPSFDFISASLGISTASISKYNAILEGMGLLVIVRHSIKTDGSYDDRDRLLFNRYNNHYYPQIERMITEGK